MLNISNFTAYSSEPARFKVDSNAMPCCIYLEAKDTIKFEVVSSKEIDYSAPSVASYSLVEGGMIRIDLPIGGDRRSIYHCVNITRGKGPLYIAVVSPFSISPVLISNFKPYYP